MIAPRDDAEYRRIVEFIQQSDLPRKTQKLAGLRRAWRIRLVGESLRVEGTAIDPSEMENSHWL